MQSGFKPFSPSAGRGRIRISTGVISTLGWDSFQESFECFGWFRTREELLCAPTSLQTEDGEHPFAQAIERVEALSAAARAPSLAAIPEAKHLVAADRLIKFDASWTNTARSQLDLKIGVDISARLGWLTDSSPPILIGTYGAILIAMSESRYLQSQEEQLTIER
jgi:hypothetical protein